MERLQNFLKQRSGGSGRTSNDATNNGQPPSPGILTNSRQNDLIPGFRLTELQSSAPLHQRLKALKELGEFVANKRLNQDTIPFLFLQVSDILNASEYGINDNVQSIDRATDNAIDLRVAAWQFYIRLIQGQMEILNTMRLVFFNLIRNYPKSRTEEVQLRLEMLKVLTENGKNLDYFRADIGDFLLKFLSDEILPGQLSLAIPFLSMLINIFKYHAMCLQQPTVAGLVENTCQLIEKRMKNNDVVVQCLALFEVIPNNCAIPPESINSYTESLCLTVFTPEHKDTTWRIMKQILQTHVGHAVIKSLCVFLQDRINHSKVHVLRGAVHFIAGTLWGDQRQTSLKHKPDAIIPCFVECCNCKHPLVCGEIAKAVHSLIEKQGPNLQLYTWSLIIDVCEMLVNNFDLKSAHIDATNRDFTEKVHLLLTVVEDISNKGTCFLGRPDKLHTILEKCASARPEESALNLIDIRAEAIDSSKADWIMSLRSLMEIFYKKDNRTSVRLRALEVLASVLGANRHTHEEALIDNVVFEFLGNVHNESDCKIRDRVVQLIVDMLQECKLAKKCNEMLDIIRQVSDYWTKFHHLTKIVTTLDP